MSTATTSISRIVVALDAAFRDFALELARDITGRTAITELVGLFVEDVELIEHASSRLAREVVLSGRERPLDRAALERQMRAQAAQARRSFESAAAKLGLRHAFEIARGEVLAELLRRTADAEALVVTVATRSQGPRSLLGTRLQQLARAPVRMVLFAREGWLAGGNIFAVVEDRARQTATLATAVRLARESRSPLVVLATGEALDESHLAGALRAEGVDLHALIAEDRFTPDTIARAARDARLLVLPAHDAASDELLIEELLAKARAPLLLVRDTAS